MDDQDTKNEDSSESLEPGALTRISDENVPARVDQAVCDVKEMEDLSGGDEDQAI